MDTITYHNRNDKDAILIAARKALIRKVSIKNHSGLHVTYINISLKDISKLWDAGAYYYSFHTDNNSETFYIS